jgi:ParB-like chromosome segregation protein Spo0J
MERILPIKLISASWKEGRKYQCIAASVREVGIIEPLAVYPREMGGTKYMLLDGHVRLEILKDLGEATAPCLVAHDDEAFTYNHKVNRLTPIQEHFMLTRAIENGLSAEQIASGLGLKIESIRTKANLLDGVCPEAVELLREQSISAGAIRELRRAKPMRQLEIVELMISTHNFTVPYVKCMIAATPDDQLADPHHAKQFNGLTADDIARMEREMATLSKEFRLIEVSHGQNTLELVVIVGYIRKLMDNARVVRYLSQHFSELLGEFQKLVETRSLRE